MIGLAIRGDPGRLVRSSPLLRFDRDLDGSGSRSDHFELIRCSCIRWHVLRSISNSRLSDQRKLRGHGGELHARRPCPASSADPPSLVRGCHCRFPLCPSPPPTHFPFLKRSTPQPQDQNTPLHHAAENGQEAACRVLIEAGAKVDAKESVSWHCM